MKMRIATAVAGDNNTSKNFWADLKKPFFALAPLDDVSDTVFREIVIRTAAPDVVFTEFASTDGFVHPQGTISVRRKLFVNKSEQQLNVPLVAQIWGSDPEKYYQTTQALAKTGLYAGIDINMGCPEKGIVKRGCCGGLIKPENRDNAVAIIQATKAAAGNLPVSVKTRIGFNSIDTEKWLGLILKQDIAVLTIHARTVREMSNVPARWDEIEKAVKLRDQIAPQTLIIGNGDVLTRAQGEVLAATTGVDGIMIGRGIFQDIFAFSENRPEASPTDMLDLLMRHVTLYESTWQGSKSFEPLKKFMKVYISGFPGASEIRQQLMLCKNAGDVTNVLAKLKLATVK